MKRIHGRTGNHPGYLISFMVNTLFTELHATVRRLILHRQLMMGSLSKRLEHIERVVWRSTQHGILYTSRAITGC